MRGRRVVHAHDDQQRRGASTPLLQHVEVGQFDCTRAAEARAPAHRTADPFLGRGAEWQAGVLPRVQGRRDAELRIAVRHAGRRAAERRLGVELIADHRGHRRLEDRGLGDVGANRGFAGHQAVERSPGIRTERTDESEPRHRNAVPGHAIFAWGAERASNRSMSSATVVGRLSMSRHADVQRLFEFEHQIDEDQGIDADVLQPRLRRHLGRVDRCLVLEVLAQQFECLHVLRQTGKRHWRASLHIALARSGSMVARK